MRRVTRLVVALIMVMAMSASVFAADITASKAKSIALKNAKVSAKKASRMRVKYDGEDGVFEVKFKSKKNGAKYEYEIAASTGTIVEKSVDYKYRKNRSRKKISRTKAMKKAAKKAGVSLAVVMSGTCKYEYDDGKGTYEIKFSNGNYSYEVEILAPTGKVIEYNWKVSYTKPTPAQGAYGYWDDDDDNDYDD